MKLPKLKFKKNLEFYILLSIPILIVLSTVVVIISIFHFIKEEERASAVEFSDSFDDVTYIDAENSSGYLVSGGQLKASATDEMVGVYGTGADGACTVSSNLNINTQSCVGRANGDAVNFSSTANTAAGSTAIILSSSPTGLAVNDEVLIINLQGTSADHSHVGEYDTAIITSITGNTLSLDRALTKAYNGTTQKIMVQRIPQYTTVTVNPGANFYPSSWNGTKGGVLSFRASGTVSINGSIDVTALGYRGGARAASPAGYASPGEGYFNISGDSGKGGKHLSAGYAGTWSGGGGGGSDKAGGVGSSLYGAVGGGGGGTTYTRTTQNDGGGWGGGGGGGGYGTPGTGGKNGALSSYSPSGTNDASGNGNNGSLHWCSTGYCKRYSSGGGGGGRASGVSDLSKLNFGGGGGGGGAGEGLSLTDYPGTDGSNGGGIVLIFGKNITVSGGIQSNGGSVTNSTSNGRAGGTGSGGAVKIIGESLTLGSSLVSAVGGPVSNTGGQGGNGRIRLEYVTSSGGTTVPAASSEKVPYYSNSTVLKSVDVVGGDGPVEVVSIVYNLSSKPAGTTASIQFSTDGSNWYNSSGVLGASNTLTTGLNNEIDLSGLSWQSSSFYYKVVFGTNNGVSTPVLDDISLVYEAAPNVPTIGVPTPLSTSSIRWNFADNATNEAGFKLLTGANEVIETVELEDLSYINETGLTANTKYTRKVTSYNALGNSGSSSSVSAYTLAEVPQLSVGDVSVSTISLGVSNSNNLTEDLSGLYFDCTGTECDGGINEWVQFSSDTVTGLSENTQYTFNVKARNGDGVETSASGEVSVYTLANIPEVTIGSVTSNSISLASSGVTNINLGASGVYFDCTGNSCDTGINSWSQDLSGTVTNLTPNTQYTFQVKARNGDGVETSYSDTQSIYTYANIPGAPSKQDSSPTTLDLTLNVNLNPAHTLFAIQETSSGKYVNKDTGLLQIAPDWGTYSEFVSGGIVRVTGLSAGTQYQFRIKAKNGDGVETDFGISTSAKTKVIVTNVPSGISAVVSTEPLIDISSDGVDPNIYDIKFLEEDVLIAEVPFDLTENRDFSELIVDADAVNSKAVAKVSSSEGFNQTFDLYIVKSGTDYVRVCPNAVNLGQVGSDCTSGVDFTDPFPQTKNVGAINVTVRSGTVGDVAYWKVEGLTGTGAMGVETPICGDGILGNTDGEECELNDPDGVSCSWAECNQIDCTCPETPLCGNGILGDVDGEECESGDPDGVSCTWSECNQSTCACPSPSVVEEEEKTSVDVTDEFIEDGEKEDEKKDEKEDEKEEEEVAEKISEQKPLIFYPEDEEPSQIQEAGATIYTELSSVFSKVENFVDKNGSVASTMIVIPTATTATAITVATGVTFSDLPYRIMQVFLGFLQSIGAVKSKKKYKPWGVVYNSVTKEPVSNAVVRLFSDGLLIDTQVTDIHGVFAFAPRKGKYVIKVRKAKFVYPSDVVTGKTDILKNNVYRGEDYTVVEDGQEISVDIPLDPLESSPSISYFQQVWSYISEIVIALNPVFLIVGATISLALYSITGNILNYVIVGVYILIMVIQIITALRRRSGWGVVKDESGKRVSGLKLGAFDKQYNQLVDVRVTDEKGRYRFILPDNEYVIKPYKSDYKLSGKNKGGLKVKKRGEGAFLVIENLTVVK